MLNIEVMCLLAIGTIYRGYIYALHNDTRYEVMVVCWLMTFDAEVMVVFKAEIMLVSKADTMPIGAGCRSHALVLCADIQVHVLYTSIHICGSCSDVVCRLVYVY